MKGAPRPVTPIGILATRLEHLSDRIATLAEVDVSIKTELQQICALASGLDPYVERCTTL
jgi:caffeoyl-CoA O-methyltransferase